MRLLLEICMTHKRSRTPAEKINDAIEKVNNLHPTLREKIFNELITIPEYNCNVEKCKDYITKKLNIPVQGRYTKLYWLSRGWSEIECIIKMKRNNPKKILSVYSREYWIQKINPETNSFYTVEEADLERNSRRPIRKEYWIVRGFTEEESVLLAKETKQKNNIKGNKSKTVVGNKIGSHKCVEYWLVRGFTEEESRELITSIDTSFSLKNSIKKYGEEKGFIV